MMNRTLKIYIALLILMFVLIIVVDANKPQPINWTPTYGVKDKIPLGLYVFNQEMPNLLKGSKIKTVSVTPYEYLDPLYDNDSLAQNYKIKGTFLSISEACPFDAESITELFYFASHGNDIFLSMKYFPKQILDSLKLKMGSEFQYKDSIYNWVANPKLGTRKYSIIEGLGNNYFSKIDTLNTSVLGYQSGDSARVNFIKVPYKNGNFILHTQPTAFSNFHLLKGSHKEYAEKVISYVPKTDILWYVKGQDGRIENRSMLRFIHAHPALKWAWLLLFWGFIVFAFFNAKRKQRIVPVIKPLTNTTIDFAKTIGNLYFQEGDHDNIIEKKIIYFLEKLRQDYLLDTTVLDDNFIKKLHHKSGKDLHDIQNVVYLINQYRKKHYTNVESDLIAINNAIEKIIN